MASIRLRLKPSIAPFRMMLSLPLSSGLKPAPISIKGATVPRIATLTGGRRVDPGQQPQQRALAGAVAADDPHALALVDLEADPAQAPRTPTLGTGASRRSTRSSTARLSEYCLSA